MVKRIFQTLIPLFFILIFWELSSRYFIEQNYIFSSPSEVFVALINNLSSLILALQTTLYCVGIAFFLSVLSVIAFIFLSLLLPKLYSYLLPIISLIQTIPLIAIAPILIIWFGFGSPTVIASSFVVSFFPFLLNVLNYIENVDKSFQELFDVYGASPAQRLIYLKIPNAIIPIINSTKTCFSLSIIGAVVGEFIAGGGLGGYIDSSRTQMRTDLVFSAILLLSLLNICYIIFADQIVKYLQKQRNFYA